MQHTFLAKTLLLSALCATSFVNASQPSPKKDTKLETKTAVVAKIGFIDSHRIVTEDPELLKNSAPQWQELYAKAQEVLKPLKNEYDSAMKKFSSIGQEFETMQKSGLSNQDAMRRKYEEAMAARGDAAAAEQRLQQASFEEGNRANSAMKKLLEEAVDAVTNAQGWDFVIAKDAIANRNVSKRFDVTDDVLAYLRKKHTDQKAQAQKKS